MSLNPNLVPTPVTDKNGVQTTRWKRPVAVSGTPNAIPAPIGGINSLGKTFGGPDEPLVELRARARKVLFENLERRGKPVSDADARAFDINIRRYPKKRVMQIPLLLSVDNDLANGVADDIIAGTTNEWVWERIHFYRITDSDNYWKTASETYALSNYAPVNLHYDMTEIDDYVTGQCLALMSVARILDAKADGKSPYLEYTSHPSGYPITIIKDKTLVYFIATQPEKATDIAETVAKYGTTDPATINGIINGIAPSLAKGSL